MSAAVAAFVAYRQGKSAEVSRRDRDIEERLRDCEFEMTDIRATIRERNQNREKA